MLLQIIYRYKENLKIIILNNENRNDTKINLKE